MSCGIKPNSLLLGDQNRYIKFYGGDVIATDGPLTREKQLFSSLRIPYKQILHGYITLKAGQLNYPLNFLQLGDNATFLSISAKYDPKSKNEGDNYIQWNFADNFGDVAHMAQCMVLTGNSTHRIKNIYLTNPNPNYPVVLDIMVAIIDDQTTFFEDTVNKPGLSLTGLYYTDIVTHDANLTIAVLNHDPVPQPILYINIVNINSIERSGQILVVDDESVGRIFLEFITEYDALQALSAMNWMMEGPNRVIQNLDPRYDLADPVVYFNPVVSLISSTYSLPHNTSMGETFSSTLSLASNGGLITKDMLISTLIYSVIDERDGIILLNHNNINVIAGSSSLNTNLIVVPGTYSMTFTIDDLAENSVNDTVHVYLNITT